MVAISSSLKQKEVFLINTYKMTLVRKLTVGFENFPTIKVCGKRLLLADSVTGQMQVWKREGGPSDDVYQSSIGGGASVKSSMASTSNSTPSQALLLDISNTEDNSVAS